MAEIQYESKCCHARVIPDYSDVNSENESYTKPGYKCIKCNKRVDSVILSRRLKQLR